MNSLLSISVDKVIIRVLFLSLIVFIAPSCKVNTDCVCVDYYHPVCGDDGITYENECLAQCAGVGYYDGTCAMDGIGQVKFTGDSLCGYLISMFDQEFKPDTLAPGFMEEDIFVYLKFRKLNQYFTCDNPYGNYQVIQVIEMNKTGSEQ